MTMDIIQSLPTDIAGKSQMILPVSFYYNAIRAGKGTWSDPYFNNANLNACDLFSTYYS